jgi:flagellar FliL protein
MATKKLSAVKNPPPPPAKPAPAAGAETQAPETKPRPARRGKRAFVALVALLALATAAAGAWHAGLLAPLEEMLVAGDTPAAAAQAEPDDADAEAPPAAAQKPKAAEKKSAIFVPVEPFTVNLQDDERERYLQVGLVVEANDRAAAEAIKEMMPLVRSQILLLLSSKQAAQLMPPQGKRALAEELLQQVRLPLASELPDRGIAQVHFSVFIIQ